MEIMVMISNPDDFISWPHERKVDRYQRVMQWHDYIYRLHEAGKAPQVWGSHQLLSRAEFTSSLGLLIAVYRVESWREFDELLLDDPLRDVSQYVTTPLSELFEDKDSDSQRLDEHKKQLLGSEDPATLRIYSEYRALYKQAPDYVDKYDYIQPENASTSLDAAASPEDPLQILIMGINPDEYVTLWDDTRKLIHYEKVLWFYDYASMLTHQGKISHAWGTHDFCYISALSAKSAGAVLIYEVDTYAEFDDLYRLDPLRTSSLFWSVLLQPLADQRRMDEERLHRARALLKAEPIEDQVPVG